MNVSYKPQKISPKFPGTVRQLLHAKIRDSYIHPQFVTDVLKPLQVDAIIDQEVLNLSGGELQRVALTLCLGQVTPPQSSLPLPLWNNFSLSQQTSTLLMNLPRTLTLSSVLQLPKSLKG